MASEGTRKRQQRPIQAVPRLALTKQEAATSLGMSVDHFERHVQPYVRVIRTGQLVHIPPAELQRWIAERAHLIAEREVA